MPFLQQVTNLIVALALSASAAHAMSASPVHIEMSSTGSAGRSQVTVTNDATTALPVEVNVRRMTLDVEGNQTLGNPGDDFLIFPPQAIIPPGSMQVFRLQWVGEPLITESHSFVVTMSQVPVKLPQNKSAVQVVVAFGVVVNVAPPQGHGALRVVGTSIAAGKSGKRHPSIMVENATKTHALLPRSTIRLSSGNWTRTLESAELDEKIGIGLVQPGRKRRFILPVDLPLGAQSVQATIDYRPKR
jgi:fimbrial chaperone protein